jgi:hypothetical protein
MKILMNLEKQEECRPITSDSDYFLTPSFRRLISCGSVHLSTLLQILEEEPKEAKENEALANRVNAIYYNPGRFPHPGPE